MCEPQISLLCKLFRGTIMYSELVKAFGRNLGECLRRFDWQSSPACSEYKADMTRLLTVHSATQYIRVYQGVLYFMNIVQFFFYGALVRVISFAPLIKSLRCPAPRCAKFTNAQRHSVQMYTAFHADGTTYGKYVHKFPYAVKCESLNRVLQNSCLFYKFIWRTPVPNFMKIRHSLVADVRS